MRPRWVGVRAARLGALVLVGSSSSHRADRREPGRQPALELGPVLLLIGLGYLGFRAWEERARPSTWGRVPMANRAEGGTAPRPELVPAGRGKGSARIGKTRYLGGLRGVAAMVLCGRTSQPDGSPPRPGAPRTLRARGLSGVPRALEVPRPTLGAYRQVAARRSHRRGASVPRVHARRRSELGAQREGGGGRGSLAS